jgi:hypothetical protein
LSRELVEWSSGEMVEWSSGKMVEWSSRELVEWLSREMVEWLLATGYFQLSASQLESRSHRLRIYYLLFTMCIMPKIRMLVVE